MRDAPGHESVPMVVMKDSDSKSFASHVCTQKGNVEWVADRLCEDLDSFGHAGTVTIKSDQEPALMDLVREVKMKRARSSKETLRVLKQLRKSGKSELG